MIAPTATKSFTTRVRSAAERNNSLLCIGLDPDVRRFPPALQAQFATDPAGAIADFNLAVIEQTADLVCAYKPNLGFYLAYGLAGLEALQRTRAAIPAEIPAILDAKVNDVGHTATAYATGYFDQFNFDAVTFSPYLGADSLRPFLSHLGKGILILCRNSNPSAGDLQDLPVQADGGTIPLYEAVAHQIARWATELNAEGAIGAVTGATYPRQLAIVRSILPDAPLLIPGIGEQGGDLEATVRAGIDATGYGAIVNASRSITYASSGADFAAAARAAAREVRDALNRGRR